MDVRLWLTVAALCIQSAAHAYGFMRLRHREVAPEFRLAWLAFLVWWLGMSAQAAVLAVRHLLFIVAPLSPAADFGFAALSVVCVQGAIGGLMVYLATVAWGPHRAHWAWAAIAIAGIAFVIGLLQAAQPVAMAASGGVIRITYARPVSPWIIFSLVPHTFLPLLLVGAMTWTVRRAEAVTARRAYAMALFLTFSLASTTFIGIGALGAAGSSWTWTARALSVVAAIGLTGNAVDCSHKASWWRRAATA